MLRRALLVPLCSALVSCSTPAPKGPEAPTGGGRLPAALRARHTLAELLERIEAPSRQQRRRGAMVLAMRDLERPLAYLQAARPLLEGARWRPVAGGLAELRRFVGSTKLEEQALRKLLASWGLDLQGPLALTFFHDGLQVALSVADQRAFRLAAVSWAKRLRLEGRWVAPKGQEQSWRFVAVPSQGALVSMTFDCEFGARRLVRCAQRSGPDEARAVPSPTKALWSRLSPTQQKLVREPRATKPMDVVALVSTKRLEILALAHLGKEALEGKLTLSGPRAMWARSISRNQARKLYALHRATRGESLYLRLAPGPMGPMGRLGGQGWSTGETLLLPGGACGLPVLLYGTTDQPAAKRGLATIASFVGRLPGMRLRAQTVGTRTIHVLSNAPGVKPALSLPQPLAFLASPLGLLAGPESCLSRGWERLQRPLPALPEVERAPPFLSGALHLGDPFATADAGTKQMLSLLSRGAPQLPFLRSLLTRLGALELRAWVTDDDRIDLQVKVSKPKGAGKRKGATLIAGAAGFMGKMIFGPAAQRYRLKSKTIEATEGLDKLRAGAKAYFQADHYDSKGNLLPKRFPKSVGWTPKVPCCKQKGKRCQPDSKAWNVGTWRKLYFKQTALHVYQYRFTSKGRGKKATFVIEARGDLDCDGVYSNYQLRGKVDDEWGVRSIGPIISKELE